MEDYYAILEVHFTASSTVIKDSYRRLALQLHPDKNPALDATAAFQQLARAWEILKDEKKRASYDREHGFDRSKSRQQQGRTQQTSAPNFSSLYTQENPSSSKRTSQQYNAYERQKRTREWAEKAEKVRKAEVLRKRAKEAARKAEELRKADELDAQDKKMAEDLAETIRKARELREKMETRTRRSVQGYLAWKIQSAAVYLGYLKDWKVFSRKLKIQIIDNDAQLRKVENGREIWSGERKVRTENLKENAEVLRERLDSGWLQFKRNEPAVRVRIVNEAIKIQEAATQSFSIPVWRSNHTSLEHWQMLGHVKGSLHSCQFSDERMEGECSRCHGPASRSECPTCGVPVCSDCMDDLSLLGEFERWLGGQESLFEITLD